ncbi:hypothetical protein BGW80DRAFT_220226 [Lactifluus volemus]|nr:hypothetical protein BGW80DRAFT_220226 [Lactifluus volemus]
MAARCTFQPPSIDLSTPDVVAPHQIGSLSMHAGRESPQDPSPSDDDLSMTILPHLLSTVTTEHPIALAQSPCPNYIVASPLPFHDDAVPPPSLHDDNDRRIPRAFLGVERRQRSRASSREAAGQYHYAKLMRAERAATKAVSSRQADFTEYAQLIPSSSLWTGPVPSVDVATVRRAPTLTPTLIPDDGQTVSLDVLSDDDRDTWDASSGFEGDVELDSEEVALPPRGHHAATTTRASSGARERLKIVVPGGKSEAYVTMAFERSCNITTTDSVNDHINISQDMSSYITSPPPTMGLIVAPPHAEKVVPDDQKKTGLKIKIPTANSAFMLSLRLASSCRVSGNSDLDIDGGGEEYYPGIFSLSSSGDLSPESVYSSSCVARSAQPEGRVARRAARRFALTPYAIDPSSARIGKLRLPN